MGTLRLLLAISVVIAHTGKIFGFGIVGGELAVQSFFIISGFYMTLILNEKYIGINNSYKLFITNRLLRLYPIYWSVILITIIASLAAYVFSSGNNFGKLNAYYEYFSSMNIFSLCFLVVTNIVLLFQDLVMFLGLDTTSGRLFFTSDFRTTNPQLSRFLLAPQAWTIGIEITFYLIAPFIVRKKLNVIYVLIILSALLRIVLYSIGLNHDPWTYRFFPTEIMFFLLGTVAYHAYKKIKLLDVKEFYYKIIFFTILLFTFSYSFIKLPYKNLFYLFAFFTATPFIFILSKNWIKDRYVGELSYPIYISHWLVMLSLDSLKIPFLQKNFGLVAVILTIFFSILLNEFISKKIEIIRSRRLKPILNSNILKN